MRITISFVPNTTNNGFWLNGVASFDDRMHSNMSLFEMFDCNSIAFGLLSLTICVKYGGFNAFNVHFVVVFV